VYFNISRVLYSSVDGLYTSNGTNVLRVTQSDVTSVHKSV